MEEHGVFSELPEALVEEMLGKSNQIGEEILSIIFFTMHGYRTEGGK